MDSPPQATTLRGGPAIAIREQIAIADLPKFFASAFAELATCAGTQAAEPPFARYHTIDASDVDVEAVMPVRAPVAGGGRVVAIDLPDGPAVQIVHTGPYDQLGTAYLAIERWLADHHRDRSEAVREVYLTDPVHVPDPKRWITVVIQPVRPS